MRLLLALLVALAAADARGATLLSGDAPVVPAGTVLDDDVYVAGGNVRVDGTIRGDLVAAGGQIDVDGSVSGDVLAAGGTIRIRGEVGGSIRAAGGEILVAGPVRGDAVVAGGQVIVTQGIGRDLLASGGTVEVNAPVARDARFGAGNVTLAADVGGDVRVTSGSLTVRAVAIGGDLAFPEDAQADIDPGARIGGRIVREPPIGQGPGIAGRILGALRLLVGLWALGALFTLAAPGWSARAVSLQRERAGAAALGGIAVLIGVPVGAAVVFGVGLLTGGWWIGPMLLALYAIACALAIPLAGRAIGGRAFPHASWPMQLLAGLVALVLLFSVPIFGGLVALIAVLFGLGGLSLAQRRRVPAPARPPA